MPAIDEFTDDIVGIVSQEIDVTLPEVEEGTGQRPFFYSILESLPAGLSFDGTARRLHGTFETMQDITTYTYMVEDSAWPHRFDTREFTIVVFADSIPMLSGAIKDQLLLFGEVTTITPPLAVNGNAPLTYALFPEGDDTASLPNWITLTENMNGTYSIQFEAPSSASTQRLTWRVTDVDNDSHSVSFDVAVQEEELITYYDLIPDTLSAGTGSGPLVVTFSSQAFPAPLTAFPGFHSSGQQLNFQKIPLLTAADATATSGVYSFTFVRTAGSTTFSPDQNFIVEFLNQFLYNATLVAASAENDTGDSRTVYRLSATTPTYTEGNRASPFTVPSGWQSAELTAADATETLGAYSLTFVRAANTETYVPQDVVAITPVITTETEARYRLSNSNASPPSFAGSEISQWSSSRQTTTATNQYEWRIQRTRTVTDGVAGEWSAWAADQQPISTYVADSGATDSFYIHEATLPSTPANQQGSVGSSSAATPSGGWLTSDPGWSTTLPTWRTIATREAGSSLWTFATPTQLRGADSGATDSFYIHEATLPSTPANYQGSVGSSSPTTPSGGWLTSDPGAGVLPTWRTIATREAGSGLWTFATPTQLRGADSGATDSFYIHEATLPSTPANYQGSVGSSSPTTPSGGWLTSDPGSGLLPTWRTIATREAGSGLWTFATPTQIRGAGADSGATDSFYIHAATVPSTPANYQGSVGSSSAATPSGGWLTSDPGWSTTLPTWRTIATREAGSGLWTFATPTQIRGADSGATDRFYIHEATVPSTPANYQGSVGSSSAATPSGGWLTSNPGAGLLPTWRTIATREAGSGLWTFATPTLFRNADSGATDSFYIHEATLPSTPANYQGSVGSSSPTTPSGGWLTSDPGWSTTLPTWRTIATREAGSGLWTFATPTQIRGADSGATDSFYIHEATVPSTPANYQGSVGSSSPTTPSGGWLTSDPGWSTTLPTWRTIATREAGSSLWTFATPTQIRGADSGATDSFYIHEATVPSTPANYQGSVGSSSPTTPSGGWLTSDPGSGLLPTWRTIATREAGSGLWTFATPTQIRGAGADSGATDRFYIHEATLPSTPANYQGSVGSSSAATPSGGWLTSDPGWSTTLPTWRTIATREAGSSLWTFATPTQLRGADSGATDRFYIHEATLPSTPANYQGSVGSSSAATPSGGWLTSDPGWSTTLPTWRTIATREAGSGLWTFATPTQIRGADSGATDSFYIHEATLPSTPANQQGSVGSSSPTTPSGGWLTSDPGAGLLPTWRTIATREAGSGLWTFATPTQIRGAGSIPAFTNTETVTYSSIAGQSKTFVLPAASGAPTPTYSINSLPNYASFDPATRELTVSGVLSQAGFSAQRTYMAMNVHGSASISIIIRIAQVTEDSGATDSFYIHEATLPSTPANQQGSVGSSSAATPTGGWLTSDPGWSTTLPTWRTIATREAGSSLWTFATPTQIRGADSGATDSFYIHEATLPSTPANYQGSVGSSSAATPSGGWLTSDPGSGVLPTWRTIATREAGSGLWTFATPTQIRGADSGATDSFYIHEATLPSTPANYQGSVGSSSAATPSGGWLTSDPGSGVLPTWRTIATREAGSGLWTFATPTQIRGASADSGATDSFYIHEATLPSTPANYQGSVGSSSAATPSGGWLTSDPGWSTTLPTWRTIATREAGSGLWTFATPTQIRGADSGATDRFYIHEATLPSTPANYQGSVGSSSAATPSGGWLTSDPGAGVLPTWRTIATREAGSGLWTFATPTQIRGADSGATDSFYIHEATLPSTPANYQGSVGSSSPTTPSGGWLTSDPGAGVLPTWRTIATREAGSGLWTFATPTQIRGADSGATDSFYIHEATLPSTPANYQGSVGSSSPTTPSGGWLTSDPGAGVLPTWRTIATREAGSGLWTFATPTQIRGADSGATDSFYIHEATLPSTPANQQGSVGSSSAATPSGGWLTSDPGWSTTLPTWRTIATREAGSSLWTFATPTRIRGADSGATDSFYIHEATLPSTPANQQGSVGSSSAATPSGGWLTSDPGAGVLPTWRTIATREAGSGLWTFATPTRIRAGT